MLDLLSAGEQSNVSALLDLLSLATGSGVILLGDSLAPAQGHVLHSSPAGLTGSTLVFQPDQLPVGDPIIATVDVRELPAALSQWAGFLPAFVCSISIPSTGSARHLLLFWHQRPSNEPATLRICQQAVGLLIQQDRPKAGTRQLEERLDTILNNVSLGILFTDPTSCLLNPLAASYLEIPAGSHDSAQVIAAMQEIRARCTVHAAQPVSGETLPATEYWILEERALVLRVESHSIGSHHTAGCFWVFTDVTPLWESTEKLKAANRVLEGNLALLAEEMDRRIEAETELVRFNMGLKQRNAVLAISKFESDLLANQDGLTGLANSRGFRAGLEKMLAQARRTGDQVAVIYIDLDKFKLVNDSLGHDQGDELLRNAARAMTHALRTEDLLGRVGGDEFTCALRLTSDKGYAEVLATARRLSEALNILVAGSRTTIRTSATIGLAIFPQDAQDVAGLLRAADNAMYLGKRNGGNEVVFFSEKVNALLPPDLPIQLTVVGPVE